MNKRIIVGLVFLCILSISYNVVAQGHPNKYYLSLWGAAGYANILHEKIPNKETPLLNPIGGVGGLLGFGFEYQHKNFIITTGAEFDFKRSTHKYKPHQASIGEIHRDENGKPTVVNGMYDTEGDPFVMYFDFDSRLDHFNIGYVNVPLLMGAKSKSGIYFLMGGKFGVNLLGFTSSEAKFSTSGYYPQFDAILKHEQDHFFVDNRKAKSSSEIKLDFNVVASLEVGKMMFFSKSGTRWHYRIAGFVDYSVGSYFGMNPQLKDGKNVVTKVVPTGDFLGIPTGERGEVNPLDVQLNPILTSNQAVNKLLNPMLVGVKFTLLFDLGNKEPCNCLEEWNSKWIRKNRIK